MTRNPPKDRAIDNSGGRLPAHEGGMGPWRNRNAPNASVLTHKIKMCIRDSKATVQKYRTELETKELAPSSINVRLSAIRRLALEARDNGRLDPDIAAGIARAKGAKRSGVRLGHWLTAEQAQALLATPVEIRRPLSPNGQQRCRLMWAARAPSRTFKSKSGSCKVA